jgi:hypothetical protein
MKHIDLLAVKSVRKPKVDQIRSLNVLARSMVPKSEVSFVDALVDVWGGPEFLKLNLPAYVYTDGFTADREAIESYFKTAIAELLESNQTDQSENNVKAR